MACPRLGVPLAVIDGCANDRQTSKGGTMGRRRGLRFLILATAGSALCALRAAVPAVQVAGAATTATGAMVSVGSPTGSHPQNAQNEPALGGRPHLAEHLGRGRELPNSSARQVGHVEDKQWIAVNDIVGSPNQDHVYAMWSVFNSSTTKIR